MANSKISALTSATTVAGTEVLPIVQSSATVKVSVANLTPGLGTITAAKGGTGQTSYAVGDLLYADTTTTLAKLADVATGNALISGGVGVAPSWGKIGLTTHVSGVLPTANGGTNLSSFTANGVMYASSTSALATGAALTFDGSQLSVLRASTSTVLFDDAEIRAINTGTATINQRVDIAMRWQDGTYNGTGGIGMVRESATARSGTLTFYPINSSGDALAAMRLSSAGDATVTTGNLVIGTSGKGVTSGNFSLGLGANGSTSAVLIDTSGNLLVGTTSAIQSGNYSCSFAGNLSNGIVLQTTFASTGTDFVRCVNSAGTAIGNITQNGATTVAYNTSSDYRLKNTITAMTGALAKVALLKPVTYKWNADGSNGEGFIAHELAEVVPDCVSGEKDGLDKDGNPKYQGIDTSFLVATLTAAIQEQQALIIQLQADVAALKGTSCL